MNQLGMLYFPTLTSLSFCYNVIGNPSIRLCPGSCLACTGQGPKRGFHIVAACGYSYVTVRATKMPRNRSTFNGADHDALDKIALQKRI